MVRKTMLALVLVVFLAAVPAYAVGPKMVDPHTFVWDRNPEPEVTGYYFYWRTVGGQFSDAARVEVPSPAAPAIPTINALTVPALMPRVDYEVAVTAHDAAGNESGFSTILPFVISIPANPKNLKKQ